MFNGLAKPPIWLERGSSFLIWQTWQTFLIQGLLGRRFHKCSNWLSSKFWDYETATEAPLSNRDPDRCEVSKLRSSYHQLLPSNIPQLPVYFYFFTTASHDTHLRADFDKTQTNKHHVCAAVQLQFLMQINKTHKKHLFFRQCQTNRGDSWKEEHTFSYLTLN